LCSTKIRPPENSTPLKSNENPVHGEFLITKKWEASKSYFPDNSLSYLLEAIPMKPNKNRQIHGISTDSDLVMVTHESTSDNVSEPPSFLWIYDGRVPSNPVPISTWMPYPVDPASLYPREGYWTTRGDTTAPQHLAGGDRQGLRLRRLVQRGPPNRGHIRLLPAAGGGLLRVRGTPPEQRRFCGRAGPLTSPTAATAAWTSWSTLGPAKEQPSCRWRKGHGGLRLDHHPVRCLGLANYMWVCYCGNGIPIGCYYRRYEMRREFR